MVKKLIIIGLIFICACRVQAANIVTVELLNGPPQGSEVEILNDNETTVYCEWFRYDRKSQVNWDGSPGQTFVPTKDFTMSGFCLQLRDCILPVKTADNKRFYIVVYEYTDYYDIEPDTVLDHYNGSFPDGVSLRSQGGDWLRFNFSVGIKLKANRHYGFLVGFRPGDAKLSLAMSARGESTYSHGKANGKGNEMFHEMQGRDMEFAVLRETNILRFDKPSDNKVADNTDEILEKAYGKLRKIGDWRTKQTVKSNHAEQIADTLWIIARAKEAKDAPAEEVLSNYRELITEFPDSAYSVAVLSKIVIIDEKNGWEYATEFLTKDSTGKQAADFCAIVLENYLANEDYGNTEKCLKFFLDNYQSNQNASKLMAQILDSIGPIKNCKQLNEIIKKNVPKDPNSQIRCAVFRQRALELLDAKDFEQLTQLSKSVMMKFPGTKLAKCAKAVLADREYQQGNFVRALTVFQPSLFAEDRLEPAIIKDIDEIMACYQLDTLLFGGIDHSKVYEALARYNHYFGRNKAGVHCFRKSAEARGLNLEIFEHGVSQKAKLSNISAEDEIWFWKGVFAADENDSAGASIAHNRFLKAISKCKPDYSDIKSQEAEHNGL